MGDVGTDLRRTLAAGVQSLPAPVRKTFWTSRRALERAGRRRRERRGDFSGSRPAQHGLDVAMRERLGVDGGYFIEAGAFDGFTQSNTYYLERACGWRGLLVEPVPFLAQEARRERPRSDVVNCGLVAPDHPADTITLRYGGTMTLVADAPHAGDWAAEAQRNMALDEPDHEFTVPARTLSSLLDEFGSPDVDLLSLDVEGYEPQVLAGLDLDRHVPRFILVEVDMLADSEQVGALLAERYAPPERLTDHDALFVRR